MIGRVLVDGDAELLDDLAQVRPRLGGETQSPKPPRATSATSRSGRASAISVTASMPVRPPPTTVTVCPASMRARRSRSFSAPGRLATS